ncbi:MAG: hypothetical protein ACE5IR_27320 [bacterium]
MEKTQIGIEETKDLFRFGASFGNALGKTFADGKFQLSEIVNFIQPVTKIPAALTGISQVDDELLDLDETEKAELLQLAKDEFDIPSEGAEEFVEDSLQLALMIFSYVQKHFLN